MLEYALELARRGFYVFPVQPNGKVPTITNWPELATRDETIIRDKFVGTKNNIGIATGKFGDGQALVVVDIDNKKGKSGDATIFQLELQGCEFPITMEVSTPSGGRHLYYVVDKPVRQGTNTLGEGVDVRSRGGFVVGPGSKIDGNAYTLTRRILPVPAPDWLVSRLGFDVERPRADTRPLDGVDPDRAAARAIEYLKTAPVAIEGQGGDLTTYKVAAKLKDMGVTAAEAQHLLWAHWNDRCDPPWAPDEIEAKVVHAYRYGREQPGAAAPEAVFEKAEPGEEDAGTHPADTLNAEYAFIKRGAFVLQETTDEKGRFTTLHLTPADMHAWFANKKLDMGDKRLPLSKVWMESETRREYDAVVFSPQKDPGPRWYNLWRGFSVEPSDSAKHPAVDKFLDHALNNVCGGNSEHFKWLMAFFAHMIQKPWEKPLVALVFKGKKGVGKNALVERVGQLLGQHFMVASDERYLLGNFNSHMESNLFFVLDEASWAGDKRAEGKLKDLITGQSHTIERKGAEPYRVDNLTRVAIIGNEKWLVPASTDERRFAVFTVGDGRKQDRKFFEDMRVGMEQGGYANLLRYLLDFDLTGIDINAAPETAGLVEQKHASLEPMAEWWHDCITSNQLVGSDWEGDLPPLIPTNRMRQAFEAWARSRNIRSRLPGRNDFVRQFAEMAPSMPKIKARPEDKDDATYSWKMPGIERLRDDWERFIGGKVDWE